MSAALIHLDGREVRRSLALACDVAVIGSGPAGATVARHLAAHGVRVLVLEEGLQVTPAEFGASGIRAMASMYREMGTSVALGPSPIPYLQGVAVGGTSVVNGAISWRFSNETLDGWIASDAGLRGTLDPDRIRSHEDALWERLGITPTDDAIALSLIHI